MSGDSWVVVVRRGRRQALAFRAMADAQVLTPSRTISAPAPARMEMRLLRRIADDVRRERRVRRRATLPPGSIAPSWSHTRRIISDPLKLLL